MTATRGTARAFATKNWMRRMMQGAVLVAVATSVPAVLGAGHGESRIQINNVAAGIAQMTQQGSVTTIRTGSQNTIINYQSLSVGAGETLNFIQPSSSSRVLNRIQGSDPTTIDGTVSSNGRVYFVNPAGVFFGDGAVVNASGVYAAAGHMTDAAFLAGNNHFTDNTGTVQNSGLLQGRAIHLVGGSVANFGQIVTTGGTGGVVTMTAGKDVYIGETTSPTGDMSVLVKVSADKSATQAGTGVVNSGTVRATGGQVALGAGDMYAAGIYNNGTLKAASISLHAHANSATNDGTLDASNDAGRGGNIEMLGNEVHANAGTLDASGTTGGGSIKLGGDFHGAPGTQEAATTVVGPDAVINADATLMGNGGQVVVWASNLTRFNGYISARGAGGGDGGRVEISSRAFLDFTGKVDVSAPGGAMGDILLDPGTITISSSGANTTPGSGSFSGSGNANYVISPATLTGLSGNLDMEADEIDVNSSVDFTGHPGVLSLKLGAVNDINFASGVSIKTVNAPITLVAGGDITFAATSTGVATGIYATGSAPVSLTAGGSINLQSGNSRGSIIQTTSGSITLVAGKHITLGAGNNTASGLTTTSGNISLTAGNATSSGHILLNGDDVSAYITSTGTGSITLQAWGGYVELENTTGSPTIASHGGDIALQASGSIALQGGASAGVSSNIDSGGGAILLSAGDTTLGGTHDNIVLGNNVTIHSENGDITLRTTDITFNGGDNKDIDAGVGTVAFEENNPTFSIGLGTGAGSMTLASSNFGNVKNAGTIRVGSDGVQSGAITAKGLSITNHATLQILANAGAGSVAVDDNGGTGISAASNIDIAAGTGGIVVAQATNAHAEVAITSTGKTLTLESAGGIGTSANRLEISGTFDGTVDVNSSGGGVFLKGLNDLNLGNVTNTGSLTDIAAVGDINDAAGSLNLGNAILNAGKGIGANGAIAVSLGASTLTTAGANAAGNVHLNMLGALPALSITTAAGSPQTVTIDSATGLAVANSITLQANDALVLHAGTGGTGNLTFSAPVALTADAITLHAGTGGGTSLVDLTNLTVAGVSAANPGALTLEQDASIAGVPAGGGAATDLTLISHQGNVTIDADQTLKSLSASGNTIVLDGNVTVTGSTSFSGALVLEKDITLTGGASSSLTIGGSVSNGSGGTWGLTTNFGGVAVLQGDVGTVGNELGSFTVQASGGTVVLGNGSAVAIRTVQGSASGVVSIGEKLLLNGNTTVTVGGGGANVTFGGTVDSGATHSALTVNTSGVTWFQGNVGAGSTLGGVTTDAAGSTELGNGGTFSMSVGSPITFNDDVVLMANTTLTAGGAGADVTFGKTVLSQAASAWNLTVNASGVTRFEGDVGNAAGQELGGLSVTNQGGTVVLGGASAITVKIVTGASANAASTGVLALDEQTILNGDTTLALVGDGTITLDHLVLSGSSSHAGLTLDTAGRSFLTGGFSNTLASELGSITTDAGGTTTLGGQFITTGAQAYNDEVRLQTDTTFQGTSLAFNNSGIAIDANIQDLKLYSDSMTFDSGLAGSVIGNSNLTLAPLQTGDNILLNTAGGVVANTLVIKGSDLAVFSGFTTMTIGYAAGTGTVTISSLPVLHVPTTIVEGGAGGTILVNAPITTSAAFDLHASAIGLNDDITTNGGNLTLDGPVTLGVGVVTLNSAGTASGGGNITVTGAISGSGATLNLMAQGTSTAGNIDLQGPVGASGALGGVNATASALTLHGNVATDGNININAGHIFLAGSGTTITISTNGGAFNAGGAAIDTDGSGVVNLNISTSAGGASTASAITLGTVGGGTINQMGSLTLIATGAGGATSNADITVGAVTLAGTGAFSADGAAFTNNGAITTAGGNVTINGSNFVLMDGDINAGSGTVSITGVGFENFAGSITGGPVSIDAGSSFILLLGGGIHASGAVTLKGTSIGQAASATISGSSASVNGGSGVVTLLGAVNVGSGGFFSNSAGAFTLGAGGISASNGPVFIKSTAGTVGLGGAIAAGSGDVTISGGGITVAAASPISGGAISLDGLTGAVSLSSTVHGTGAVTISGAGITQVSGATITGSSASLNGGSGVVTLGDAVNVGSGGFFSNSVGAFTLGAGGISASNGPVFIKSTAGTVGLGGAIAAGSGDVTISGGGITVAAASPISGGAISLDGLTGAVSLSSTVHGIGAVTISGAGITQASGATITGSSASLNGGSGAVLLSDTVNAGSGFFSNSTGAFVLNGGGAINTTNGTVYIKSTGGSVGLAGAIGAGTGSVTVSGIGITQTAAAPITGGAISLDGGAGAVSLNADVMGSGAVSVSGAGITQAALTTLHGSVASLNGGAGAVVLSGSITAAGGFTSTSTGAFTLNAGGVISTTGGLVNINSSGPVTVNAGLNAGSGAVSLTGVGITSGVGGTITGGTVALASGAGTVGLSALVTATNGFTSTGSGTFSLNAGSGITTTDADVSINHAGGIALAADIHTGTKVTLVTQGGVTQTAGTVTAGTLVLGGTGNFVLTDNNAIGRLAAAVTGTLNVTNGSTLDVASASAATVVFTAPTVTGGNIVSSTSITINGDGNFTGPLTAGAGNITITGDATISGNVSATGGSVSFGGALALSANVTAAGNISTVGGVTLSGGGTSTLTAAGTTGITLGDITGNRSLTMIVSDSSAKITVGAIGSSGTPVVGDIVFSAAPSSLLNGVELGGDIYARNVTFKATGGPLAAVAKVATVESRGDLIINATQKITMEKNQKITALGSLSLTAPTLTLGDISALGTIILDAKSPTGSIIFVQRSPGTNVGLTHPDQGVDVVSYSQTTLTPNTIAAGFPAAGTTIALRGTVSVVGSLAGQRVEFCSLTADTDLPQHGSTNVTFLLNGDPALAGKAPELPLIISLPFNVQDSLGVNKPIQNVTPDDVASGNALTGTVKDLVATGVTGNSPEEGRVIPRDEEMLIPEENTAITGALRDVLTQAGINARDLRIDEIVSDLLHLAVYDDVPYELDPQPKDYRVAVSRLPYAPVLPVVDMTRNLLLEPVLDANGKQVTENGRPKYSSKADKVKNAIGEAWSIYTTDKGDAAKPAEFRAYLEQHASDPKLTLALGYLNQLRDLLAAIKNLGLTPKEYDVSRTVLLEKLRFNELISKDDFPLMVDGPSSLNGKVVIDAPAPKPAETPAPDKAPDAPATQPSGT